ncbi:MAG TPA: hypothetical protein DCP28_31120 [Cytophagales bacterium]|nr:hypothetical protein [Cytophagales bacterium]
MHNNKVLVAVVDTVFCRMRIIACAIEDISGCFIGTPQLTYRARTSGSVSYADKVRRHLIFHSPDRYRAGYAGYPKAQGPAGTASMR